MERPRLRDYMGPLIEALKELGGSGTPSEVRATIKRNLNLSDITVEEAVKKDKFPFCSFLCPAC